MTGKKFFIRYILVTLSIIALVIGINCYVDIYGLFRGKKDRKVYINERTSKYLFSYRYIPENFEGIIVGPSLSANLNPEELKEFKVYNASIMGANISELDYLIDNIVAKGHIKFAIICLSPYLTKDHGRKSATIDPKEYYGALGSTNLLRTYLLYFVRKYNLAPSRYAQNIHNTSGWDNFALEMHNMDAKDTIISRAKRMEFDSTKIDHIAYNELRQTIEKLRANNIKVIGYFTPIPYQLYQLDFDANHKFVDSISTLFNDKDILINMNDEKYKTINEDYNSFIDHGHLSAQGQSFVLHVLDSTLKQMK